MYCTGSIYFIMYKCYDSYFFEVGAFDKVFWVEWKFYSCVSSIRFLSPLLRCQFRPRPPQG
jgi:hypothetical protein